tara:strand:- start:1180 stop:1320 length:141 start_codon:yes stop_codon:yes gene_type:complete
MAGQAQKKVEASNMALLTHLSLGLLISLVRYLDARLAAITLRIVRE